MPTVILLAFPLFFDSDTVCKAYVLPDPFQSWLPHPVTPQKPFCSLQPSSNATSSRKPHPLQSMRPGRRSKKKKKIGLLFGLLPRILWNTFSHKTGGHSCLSEGLSSPAHPLPYFPGKIGIDHSVGEGWARLLF